MLRVIGPALLDGALWSSSAFADVSEAEVIEAMAGAVSAAGPLSALRFGDGAYGVLPLAPTDTGEAQDTGTKAGNAIATLATTFGQFVEHPLARLSQDRSLKIEPEDPDAVENLGLIPTANRASRRLDVGLAGEDEVNPVGCPYVAGAAAEYQPNTYLQRLLDEPLDQLPDPASGNRLWPLL